MTRSAKQKAAARKATAARKAKAAAKEAIPKPLKTTKHASKQNKKVSPEADEPAPEMDLDEHGTGNTDDPMLTPVAGRRTSARLAQSTATDDDIEIVEDAPSELTALEDESHDVEPPSKRQRRDPVPRTLASTRVTRERTDKNLHPAKAQGLDSHTRVEIAAAKAARDAIEEAAREEKAAITAAQSAKEKAGLPKVAAALSKASQARRALAAGDDEPELSEGEGGDGAKGGNGEEDDEDEEMEIKTTGAKPSRRVRRRDAVLEEFDQYRDHDDDDDDEPIEPPRYKTTNPAGAGLSSDWRARTQNVRTPAAASGKARKEKENPSGAAATSKPKPKRPLRLAASDDDMQELDPDFGAGFDDDSVATRKEDVAFVHKHGNKQLASVTYADDMDTPVRPKAKRASPTKPSTEDSLSVTTLPPAVFAKWNSKIIPTLIEIVGASENVWGWSGQDLVDELDTLFGVLFPNHTYEIKASEKNKIYAIANAAIRTWRKKVYRTAKAFVDKKIKSIKGDPKAYVKDALHKSRSAFFGNPGTAYEKPSLAGHSPVILNSIAIHLEDIRGAHYNSGKQLGALALIFTAVQYAYQAWQTGVYGGDPTWKQANTEAVMARMRSVSVQKIADSRPRYKALMAAAEEQRKELAKKCPPASSVESSHHEAIDFFDEDEDE
ncbi:hypothetical protein PENSPDRAFT_694952 [Peniophora sp. CONT]|nr:hypothetical protein PENSPDRAFT_694952 [Peniophora sp. CONT]